MNEHDISGSGEVTESSIPDARETGMPLLSSHANDHSETASLSRAEIEARLAAAEQTNAARATFLATMSHELREPMNGVLGMARLLRETPLDAEQCSYVDAVVGSAEALISLINDILDLSRIDAGQNELAEVDFALRPFFKRLAPLLEARASRKGIAFRIELPENLPAVVRGDPGRLRQMLINLAGNAIKFTGEGEVVITIVTETSEEQVRLGVSVRDTGPGIPPEVRARLFTAFAQADATIPRLFGGSGLGLMIAQRLARAMGGEIGVESDGVRGSTFSTTLLLERGNEENEGAAVPRADLAGTSMLVVDEQERSRRNVEDLTRLWQMHSRGAASVKEAWSILEDARDRGQPFDFVLVDRSLPDGSGDELGERVRHMSGMEHARLVLMVSSGMRGDAARAREAGFDAYLPKPLTSSTLLDSLQQLRAGTGDGALVTIHSVSDNRSEPLRILVADDNPVNSRLAAIMLERMGHSVTIVADGAAAVERVDAEPFDVVLMDIQMPVMSGLDASRAIRALGDPAKSSVPIVAITANAMRGDDQPCYEAGMNGYVTKPIDRASLVTALADVTGGPRTRQASRRP